MKTIVVRYFGSVRERIGTACECYTTKATILSEFIIELADKSPKHKVVFANSESLRAAIDHQLCALTASLENATEVAFFPPMTGG